jgi:hypothetical protein
MQRPMMDGLDDLFGTDFKRFTVNAAVKPGERQQR